MRTHRYRGWKIVTDKSPFNNPNGSRTWDAVAVKGENKLTTAAETSDNYDDAAILSCIRLVIRNFEKNNS
jgi:hypothetical protein